MQAQKNATKIVLLGQSGAGKTSIIMQYVRGTFSESPNPTIGSSFITKTEQINITKQNPQGANVRRLIPIITLSIGPQQLKAAKMRSSVVEKFKLPTYIVEELFKALSWSSFEEK